jgi:hypothetical protein
LCGIGASFGEELQCGHRRDVQTATHLKTIMPLKTQDRFLQSGAWDAIGGVVEKAALRQRCLRPANQLSLNARMKIGVWRAGVEFVVILSGNSRALWRN